MKEDYYYLGHYTYYGVVYSKKNSKNIVRNRTTGKMMLISNKNASKMEHDMICMFRQECTACDRRVPATSGKVKIRMGLYRKDNVRRDLDNALTSVMDGLVGAGVIPDDSVNYVSELTIVDAGVDKAEPRVEIQVSM